ncbi:MAG: recombinase family protein, partial [Dehalococcoidia bacterium]
MPNAAIYCRVSTTDQKDNGTSLETQEAAARLIAAQLGLIVSEEYVILEDWSGTDLERPGLLRLLYLAEAGLIDALIMLNSDRLYRPEEEGDEWRIFPVLQRFEESGVELIWTDPSAPKHGPMASFLTFVSAWKSGDERRTILRRTRTGRLATARKGGLLGGYVPHGYDYVPRAGDTLAHLIINEAQAYIVQEMFRCLVEEGLSCRAIALRLTEMGIPTPQGNKVWQPSVVNHMLKQELYCGVMYFNRREPVRPQQRSEQARTGKNPKSSRRLRPEEEWIPIPVPAIIDRTTWERAQEQLQANSRFSPRNNTRHTYLLRGLARCGICGKAFSGVTINRRGRDYRYYVCNQRYSLPGEERCSSKHVPLLLLERTVWEVVAGLVQEPDKLELEYQSRQVLTEQDSSEQERKRLNAELKRLAKASDRFLDLYGDERFDREQLDNKLYENASQRNVITDQLQVLDRRKREEANRQRQWQDLKAFCDTVKLGLSKLTEDERQKLLRLLVERVTIKGKSIRIELAVPLGEHPDVYGLRPTRAPPSPPETRSIILRASEE